jgi:uncharacterized protein (DUF433 family)
LAVEIVVSDWWSWKYGDLRDGDSHSAHLRINCLYCAFSSLYSSSMDYSQIITMEPGKRSGKPCIRGLRVTVGDVLGYLASGMTHAEILSDFPFLTEDDIRACLAFAADRERKSETLVA